MNEVLVEVSNKIGPEHSALVRDFIENREYEVAKEWLLSLTNEMTERFGDDVKLKLRQIDATIDPN